jgi:DNA-directed RNA polymerase specialized sigma24 family protein
MYAAARNLALKHFRDTGREAAMDEVAEEPPDSSRRGPLRRLLDEELAAQVREAIFNLPLLQREALLLFEYEGLSMKEVAEIAGTDVGAIKARCTCGQVCRLNSERRQIRGALKGFLTG